jgi:hypothetical protein
MNASGTTTPTTAQRRTSLSGRLLALIAAGTVLGALTCGGAWVGIAWFAFARSKDVLEGAGLRPAPLIAPTAADDWWTSRVFSQVYTAALDAVVADPQVIEQLGDGVGPDFEADSLYRRFSTGSLNPQKETIEFDIQGARGSAVVTVVVSGAGEGQLTIREIRVEPDDGPSIDVPPPPEQTFRPQ